jgi:hypothetical protein
VRTGLLQREVEYLVRVGFREVDDTFYILIHDFLPLIGFGFQLKFTSSLRFEGRKLSPGEVPLPSAQFAQREFESVTHLFGLCRRELIEEGQGKGALGAILSDRQAGQSGVVGVAPLQMDGSKVAAALNSHVD